MIDDFIPKAKQLYESTQSLLNYNDTINFIAMRLENAYDDGVLAENLRLRDEVTGRLENIIAELLENKI